jgi:esterase/lipase superfamily enzyme
MEALRTLALQGRRDVLDALAGVILIAPDIDVDVFRAQAAAIGALPQPFVVFTSKQDKALRLSARMSGQTNRLGTLQDIETVGDIPVTFIDVSEFYEDSETSHFVAGSSPQLIRILGRLADVDAAFQRDAPARMGLLPGTVLTVQNATQIILSPVAALGGAAAP